MTAPGTPADVVVVGTGAAALSAAVAAHDRGAGGGRRAVGVGGRHHGRLRGRDLDAGEPPHG